MVSVSNVNQLGCNTQAVSNFPHTSLKHRSHIQLFRDEPHVGMLPLEEKAGSSSRHLKLIDLRQRIDDFFRNTVGEELVLRIGTHIDKRQNGDRRLRSTADGTIFRDLCDEAIS